MKLYGPTPILSFSRQLTSSTVGSFVVVVVMDNFPDVLSGMDDATATQTMTKIMAAFILKFRNCIFYSENANDESSLLIFVFIDKFQTIRSSRFSRSLNSPKKCLLFSLYFYFFRNINVLIRFISSKFSISIVRSSIIVNIYLF